MNDIMKAVVERLRAECDERSVVASQMRFGKTRACEFAYLCGLRDAADRMEATLRAHERRSLTDVLSATELGPNVDIFERIHDGTRNLSGR